MPVMQMPTARPVLSDDLAVGTGRLSRSSLPQLVMVRDPLDSNGVQADCTPPTGVTRNRTR